MTTHCDVGVPAHHQLSGSDGVDRAGCRGERHRFEDGRIAAHEGDTADLEAQPASVLGRSKKPRILAAVALGVLDHFTFGFAEDANLEGLLDWDQAGVIAATAHDCRRCSGRNRLAEWRRPGTIVVPRLGGGDVAAVDGGVGVAAVGVKIARDLGVGRRCQ